MTDLSSLGNPTAEFVVGTMGICMGSCDSSGVCDNGRFKCLCLAGYFGSQCSQVVLALQTPPIQSALQHSALRVWSSALDVFWNQAMCGHM